MNNVWGMVKRNITTHLTIGILCALIAFVGNMWIGFALGAFIYFAFLVIQYADGCDRGERACTLRDTVEKIKKEGKQPDDTMLKQVYNPSMAVKAFLITALPLCALAVINLLLADPEAVNETTLGTITRIVFFPAAWLTRLFTEMVGMDYTGVIKATNSVVGAIGRTGINYQAAIESLSGVTTYAVAYDLYYLTIMRVCYIVISFLAPAAMMLGYMRGPKLREQRLKEIAKGTRRKAKKLKVFGSSKPRERKQAKPEV